MTVIKGNNKSYFTRPGSAQVSDSESLHLGSASASDAESLSNEPVGPSRLFHTLVPKTNQSEEPVNLKRSSGKRKVRRYQNRCLLQTLLEEEDESSLVIINSHKSPFARLLEDTSAMKYWNNFIEKSDQEQADIINAFSQQYHKEKSKSDIVIQNNKPPLGRVSSLVKRTLKTKKNLSMESVQNCEIEMLEFFEASPQDVYVKSPTSSFDRLLLKAIAHYHGLQIKCVAPSGENLKPCIEIFNMKEKWVPANCFLTDFIHQLR
ncbi:R3H domain-containing protein 4-like [Euwallacea fornicatus]|uniref:R3H domain-containing protein 4-like n=1 Tax=Euwallacea fornicatus TaxID=995702 RepID=UPI00338DC4B3